MSPQQASQAHLSTRALALPSSSSSEIVDTPPPPTTSHVNINDISFGPSHHHTTNMTEQPSSQPPTGCSRDNVIGAEPVVTEMPFATQPRDTLEPNVASALPAQEAYYGDNLSHFPFTSSPESTAEAPPIAQLTASNSPTTRTKLPDVSGPFDSAPTRIGVSDGPFFSLLTLLDSIPNVEELLFRPFVIYLCSGGTRPGSLSSFLEPHGIDVLCIDNANMGYTSSVDDVQCLVSTRVADALVRLTFHSSCVGVIATPPCRTFSVATHSDATGPAPYRNIFMREGIRVNGLLPTKVGADNEVARNCVRICRAAMDRGLFFIWENPVPRGYYSPWAIEGRELHCSIWEYPPVRDFLLSFDAHMVAFDQCMTGHPSGAEKTTGLVGSPNVHASLVTHFSPLQCRFAVPAHDHSNTALVGRDPQSNSFRTSGAETFSPEMNRLLSECVLEFYFRQWPPDGVPSAPPASPGNPHSVLVASVTSTGLPATADRLFGDRGQSSCGSPSPSVSAPAAEAQLSDIDPAPCCGQLSDIATPADCADDAYLSDFAAGGQDQHAPGASTDVSACPSSTSTGPPPPNSFDSDGGCWTLVTEKRQSASRREQQRAPAHSRNPFDALLDSCDSDSADSDSDNPPLDINAVDAAVCIQSFWRRHVAGRSATDLRRSISVLSLFILRSLPSWRRRHLATRIQSSARRLLAARFAVRFAVASAVVHGVVRGFVQRRLAGRASAATRIQTATRRLLSRRLLQRVRGARLDAASSLLQSYARVMFSRQHLRRLRAHAVLTTHFRSRRRVRLARLRRLSSARRIISSLRAFVASRRNRRTNASHFIFRAVRSWTTRRSRCDTAAYGRYCAAECLRAIGAHQARVNDRSEALRRFDSYYAHASVAESVNFNESSGVAKIVDASFLSPNGTYDPCPFNVNPDSCCSSAFLSPAAADWLIHNRPDCITVVDDRSQAATVNVVNESSTVIVDMTVRLHHLHFGEHAVGTLDNVRVVRGFDAGLLLGNPFHRSRNSDILYSQNMFCFDSPDGTRSCTPFRVSPSSLSSAYHAVEAIKPIAFTPQTVTIPARCEYVLQARAPSGAEPGSTVLITPLEDSRADIGVLVSHGIAAVGEDGYLKVKVINPYHRKVVLPLMTPLARITLDPDTVKVPPEFSVDEIMSGINLGPELSEEQTQLVRDMFSGLRTAFASEPKYAHGIKCHVDTPAVDSGSASAPTISQPRWSSAQSEAMKGVLDAQVKAGYIARTSSDWSARPLLVAKQPSGEWRLVVNFKALNDLSVGDRFPIPSIQDNLDRVGKAKWFTAIDLLAGFHQIEMDETAYKTAFQTPWGQYMYVRMPMGLKSAPSTFCRVVNAMLQGLPPGIAIDYIDDILIPTDGSFEDHVRDVGMVFTRIIESGFTVKAKKCYVGFREVPYLGYLVGVNGTRLDPAKTKAIRDMPIGAAVGNPASYLGMIQHYSKHIPNFAILAAPFYELKRCKQPDRQAYFSAHVDQIRASYDLLQHSIAHAAVLQRPDFSKPFVLATDASGIGAGAVLAQIGDDGVERPVAFWSHLFNYDERGGSVIDREGRAVRDAVRHFRTYLTGCDFTVFTDHAALVYLMVHSHSDNSIRQRWQSQLQEFSGMTIDFRPGKDNIVPDAISRLCGLVSMSDEAVVRSTDRLSCYPSSDLDALVFGGSDAVRWIGGRAVVVGGEPGGEKGGEASLLPSHGPQPLRDADRPVGHAAPRPELLDAGASRHAVQSAAGCASSDSQLSEVEGDPLSLGLASSQLPGAHSLVNGQLSEVADMHDSVTLQDMEDFVRPRSFMVTADTPSSSATLQAERDHIDHVTSAAHTLGLVASEYLETPEESPPTPPALPQRVTVPPVKRPNKKVSPGGSVIKLPNKKTVSTVLVSDRRILLFTHSGENGGPTVIPGGPMSLASMTYREHALLHFVSFFGCHVHATVTAIQDASYRCECGSTVYFVASLPAGTDISVVPNAYSWIHPSVGLVPPGPAGSRRWADLDNSLLQGGLLQGDDLIMATRLVKALAAPKGTIPHVRLRDILDASAIATPPSLEGFPSEQSKILTARLADGNADPHGPSLHDCPSSSRQALAWIWEAVISDVTRVLSVDLEGTLKPGGVVEFIQVSATNSSGQSFVHVFDIRADASPLTGAGLDGEGETYSLRTMLEDPGIRKVFHCLRGDASVLSANYGILVRNAYDTAVGDALCRACPKGSSRNLGKTVAHWTRHTLPLKDQIEHSPAAWRHRPIEPLRFEYCYGDVLYLREVYLAQECRLHELGLFELALSYAQQGCPPLSYPIDHGLYARPQRVAILLHDLTRVVCFSDEGATSQGQPFIPSAPFGPTDMDRFSKVDYKAGYRNLWDSIAGSPVKGLAHEIVCRVRKGVRLGGSLLFECRVECIDEHFAELITRSLAKSGANNPTHRHRSLHLAQADLALSHDSPFEDWERLCFQFCRHQSMIASPPSVATAPPDLPSPQIEVPKAIDAFYSLAREDVKRVAALVLDSGGAQTLHLSVDSSQHGRHLTSVPFSPDERLVDLALRSLEYALGPVLCYHTAPKLSTALLASAPGATVCGPYDGTLVLVLTVGCQWDSLRAELATCFEQRRTTDTLIKSTPSWSIAPWDASVVGATSQFSSLTQQAYRSLTPSSPQDAFFTLSNPGSHPCAKDTSCPPTAPTSDTSNSRAHSCAKDALASSCSASIAILCEEAVAISVHGSAASAAFVGHGPTLSAAQASAEGVARAAIQCDLLDISWLAPDGGLARVSRAAMATHPHWCSYDEALVLCRLRRWTGLYNSLRSSPPEPSGADDRGAVHSSTLELMQIGARHRQHAGITPVEGPAPPLPPCTPRVRPRPPRKSLAERFSKLFKRAALPLVDENHTLDAFLVATGPLPSPVDPSLPKGAGVKAVPRVAVDYSQTPPWRSAPESTHQSCVHEDDKVNAAGSPAVHSLPSREDLIAAQASDPRLGLLVSYLSDPTSFQNNPLLSAEDQANVKRQAHSYRLIDGVLHFGDVLASSTASEFDQGGRWVVSVPRKLQQAVLHSVHCSSGHLGVARTLALLRLSYHWPGMRQATRKFVRQCHVCARTKVPPRRAGESVRVENGDRPWDVVTIDLYSYELVDGFDHVLVMADGFGRGVEAVACKGTPSSQEVLDCIFHRIIRGHRTTPRIIRSDHGSIFVSELCEEFYSVYGIALHAGAPEHHSTAGLAERFNATLHDLLITHRLSSGDKRWYLYLGHLELCYNTSVHRATGHSPVYIEYGHDGRLPWSLQFFGLDALSRPPKAESIRDHVSHMHATWDAHRSRLAAHALAVKRELDGGRHVPLKFQVHDRVLLRRLPGHAKWIEPFHGPYRISECLPNDNYRLRDLNSRQLVDYAHVDRLVPYPEVTIHDDAAPAPNEYFVKRLMKRRPRADGGFDYLVRWRGFGPADDQWLPFYELGNCHELIAELHARLGEPAIDPMDDLVSSPPDTPPAVVPTLAEEPSPAQTRASARSFARQPDPSSVPPPDLPEADEPIPLDGQIAPGIYAIDRLLAVSRPARSRGALHVQILFKGIDPTTGVQWEPEWHPLSYITDPELRREARQMEATQYASAPPDATPPPVTPAQGSSTRSSFTETELAALSVIRNAVVRHLRSITIVPVGRRSPDGPTAIRSLNGSDQFMLCRDSKWSWVPASLLSSTAETRRCRSACLATGLTDTSRRI